MLLVRWLTLISWMAWLYFYWRGGSLIIADILSALKTPHARLDAALLIVMTAGTFVIMATGLLVGVGIIQVNPAFDFLSAAGAVLTLAGMGGTLYCRHYLGGYWTAETRLKEDHQLIDSGPYSLARHPIYLFAIVMYAGLALTFPVWQCALTALVINGAYILKTRDEDEYLRQNLPGYQAYTSRVPYRLIPMIW